MTETEAKNAMTLLERVQLTGKEVPVYFNIMNSLEHIASGRHVIVEAGEEPGGQEKGPEGGLESTVAED